MPQPLLQVDRVNGQETVNPSPVQGGRPLKVTFHSETLSSLPTDLTDVVELLHELAQLPEIDALTTKPGPLPHVEIGPERADLIELKLQTGQSWAHRAVFGPPTQWSQLAEQAAAHIAKSGAIAPDEGVLRDALIVGRTHCAFDQDILITASPWLINPQSGGPALENPLRGVNARSPVEAAKLIGLFLRQRDIGIARVIQNVRLIAHADLFYLLLAQDLLPSYQAHWAATIAASKTLGDDFLYLGQSLLVRATRALEARDAIGAQFYLPQNNNTADKMAYHFEYLTLLIDSIFDVLARMAAESYSVSMKNPAGYSFGNKSFVKRLENGGAIDACTLVRSERWKALAAAIVPRLRNTIHAAALHTVVAYEAGLAGQPWSYMQLPERIADERFIKAMEFFGALEDWGVTGSHPWMFLEPYACAIKLVEEGLYLANDLAGTIDVSRLVADKSAIPSPKDSFWPDWLTDPKTRRWIRLLG